MPAHYRCKFMDFKRKDGLKTTSCRRIPCDCLRLHIIYSCLCFPLYVPVQVFGGCSSSSDTSLFSARVPGAVRD